MDFVPEIQIKLQGGWILTLIYLLVNLGVPLIRKGALARLLNQKENDSFFIRTKINLLTWWGTILLPILLPLKTGSTLFWIGLILYSTGAILTGIALYNYASAPDNKPATTGLYRFSRNPIYESYILIGYGIGLLVGSWLIMILHTIQIVGMHFVILGEEKFCLKRYGKDYESYVKGTPRYWISGLFSRGAPE